MCILPSIQTSYYDSIKKYLSSDCPVPSQCVRAQTLNKQGMMLSVTTKIAMQMICKLGGELWAVALCTLAGVPLWESCPRRREARARLPWAHAYPMRHMERLLIYTGIYSFQNTVTPVSSFT